MAPLLSSRTGKATEQSIAQLLREAGYCFKAQDRGGKHPWGSTHIVDFLIRDRDTTQVLYDPTQTPLAILSLKFQGVGGTADEKVPFELLALRHALDMGRAQRAYILIVGEGMRAKLRAWYLAGGPAQFMNCTGIKVIDYDRFTSLVNRGEL